MFSALQRLAPQSAEMARSKTTMAPFTLLVAIAMLFALATAVVDPKIMWEDCTGPADHPTIKEGNYYNLCIKGKEFEDEDWVWTLTKSSIFETDFTNCVFKNTNEKTSNFTSTTWKDVTFTECTFKSFNDQPMVFEKTLLENVVFKECVFDATADLIFSRFEFRNVEFIDCSFESQTTFELGQINSLYFNNSNFRRSADAKAPSGDDSILFENVLVRKTFFTDNTFVTPLRFQSAQLADIHFNDTSFEEFWCHNKPAAGKEPSEYGEFNDTLFDRVNFNGDFHCENTRWRGFYMGRVNFFGDAIMKGAEILDLYWDRVRVKSDDKSCTKLDMSKAYIKRKVLANTTIDCQADFSEAHFEQVFIRNLNARRANFDEALFSSQEFVDGQCCTRACFSLGCKCNITEDELSGDCPLGSSKVNVNQAAVCFAADASVSLESGAAVRMDELEHSHSVAIGGGDHSDVVFFGHRDPDAVAEFVRIEKKTASGAAMKPLFISPSHYLYVNGRLAVARSVVPGDVLRGVDGEDVTVLSVAREFKQGVFAPTTMHGDIAVDGVVASSYTDALHPETAHKLLTPVRALHDSPLRPLVARLTSVMHRQSFDWAARMAGLSSGPEVVDDL